MSEVSKPPAPPLRPARTLERLDGRLGPARLQLREAEVRHQRQQLAAAVSASAAKRVDGRRAARRPPCRTAAGPRTPAPARTGPLARRRVGGDQRRGRGFGRREIPRAPLGRGQQVQRTRLGRRTGLDHRPQHLARLVAAPSAVSVCSSAVGPPDPDVAGWPAPSPTAARRSPAAFGPPLLPLVQLGQRGAAAAGCRRRPLRAAAAARSGCPSAVSARASSDRRLRAGRARRRATRATRARRPRVGWR